ncbi:hypothetical protein [Streptomyces specialis]|uniref:hypothetical protein n=1 Tax=Streptomyces specialis TaxID=498367 RepID=UPI000A97A848|nr:hypothetical protein [Streptomyces specialis]
MLTVPEAITWLDADSRRVLEAVSVLHSPWDRTDMEVGAGDGAWRSLHCLEGGCLF